MEALVCGGWRSLVSPAMLERHTLKSPALRLSAAAWVREPSRTSWRIETILEWESQLERPCVEVLTNAKGLASSKCVLAAAAAVSAVSVAFVHLAEDETN